VSFCGFACKLRLNPKVSFAVIRWANLSSAYWICAGAIAGAITQPGAGPCSDAGEQQSYSDHYLKRANRKQYKCVR